MGKSAGRPRKYDDRAEKQRAYRERVERERWALADEVERLRRQLEIEGRTEAASLLNRVQGALHHGRLRKSDPLRSGPTITTSTKNTGHDHTPPSGLTTLREAVTVAATQTAPTLPPMLTAPLSPPSPEVLRVLVLGVRQPSAPHHRSLWDDMQAGATLQETAADVWRLTRANGESRTVDKRTVDVLLKRGTLRLESAPQPQEVQADSSPIASPTPAKTTTPPAPEFPKPMMDIVRSLEAGCMAGYDYGERKWLVRGQGQWYPVQKRELTKLYKAGLIEEERGVYRAKHD